jgi:LPS O-antigen subunit length determinant protein (WzzB/FepE family)
MKEIYKAITSQQLSIDKVDKKLNFIIVRMKDLNEQFSKEFVETLVDNATRYYVNYKSGKARKNYQLVSRLTDSVKGLLYGNIESYAATSDLNVNPLRQIVRTGGQKIQVNAQANTALYTELLKQLGLAQITLQRETPLVQVIDNPVLPLKNEKKSRLMTGILFAFIGFLITSGLLLLLRWIKSSGI